MSRLLGSMVNQPALLEKFQISEDPVLKIQTNKQTMPEEHLRLSFTSVNTFSCTHEYTNIHDGGSFVNQSPLRGGI